MVTSFFFIFCWRFKDIFTHIRGSIFNKHTQYEPQSYIKFSKFFTTSQQRIQISNHFRSQCKRHRVLSFSKNNEALYLLAKSAASVSLMCLLYYMLWMFNPINRLANVLSLPETNCQTLVTKSKLIFVATDKCDKYFWTVW